MPSRRVWIVARINVALPGTFESRVEAIAYHLGTVNGTLCKQRFRKSSLSKEQRKAWGTAQRAGYRVTQAWLFWEEHGGGEVMTKHGTGIEWTHIPGFKGETWNPVVGCSLASPGCSHCYAMAQAARIERMGGAPHYAGLTQTVNGNEVWTGKLALAKHKLDEPLRWTKPRAIFVNSMGDLFHEDVPDDWIDRVLAVTAACPQHTFIILTKRAERMRTYFFWDGTWARARIYDGCRRLPLPRSIGTGRWPLPNVWLGVSCEDQKRAEERIAYLLDMPAAVRFVSAEPLIGPIDLQGLNPGGAQALDALRGVSDNPPYSKWARLDWVIVGGESGSGARPMHPDWVRSIRDQCDAAGVPFFLKQWGEWLPVDSGHPGLRGPGYGAFDHCLTNEPDGTATHVRAGKRRSGHQLDGREHVEFPRVVGGVA